jgi:hypothetical protein
MQKRSFYISPKVKKTIAAIVLFALPATALGAAPAAGFEAGSVHVDRYGSGNPAAGPYSRIDRFGCRLEYDHCAL